MTDSINASSPNTYISRGITQSTGIYDTLFADERITIMGTSPYWFTPPYGGGTIRRGFWQKYNGTVPTYKYAEARLKFINLFPHTGAATTVGDHQWFSGTGTTTGWTFTQTFSSDFNKVLGVRPATVGDYYLTPEFFGTTSITHATYPAYTVTLHWEKLTD